MSLAEHGIREQDYRQAIAMFQSAVDRDPGYAPAWAGLGLATSVLGGGALESVPTKEVSGPATAAVEKALALDPDLPEAHYARAFIAAWHADWDFAKAQAHFERALELRPGYGPCHGSYAEFLIVGLHDFERGRVHMDRARELDPFSPFNSFNRVCYLNFKGQPEQAVEEGRRLIQAEPDNWILLGAIGWANLRLGKFDEAVRDFEGCLKVTPERPLWTLGLLGLAYGRAGRREDARKILAEFEQAERTRYVSPVSKACVHAGLGQKDEVFRLLDKALEDRVSNLLAVSINSFFLDSCVKDPRWPDLQARIRRAVKLPAGANPWGKP